MGSELENVGKNERRSTAASSAIIEKKKDSETSIALAKG